MYLVFKRALLGAAVVALSILGLSTSAFADFATPFGTAVQWGEIRQDGVRGPTSGHRFLNSSGPNASNPADAYFRFDVSGLKSDLDSQFGSGNWFLTDLELALTQSNFSGTTDGLVDLYHIQNDSVAITSGQAGDGPGDDFSGLDPSTLVYGDWAGLNLGNSGNPVLSYTFTETATGDVDLFGQADGMDFSSMANWVGSNDFLTFVLVADDTTVASYKGNEFQGRLPPQIRFTATAIPEPSSIGILAAALLGLCFHRRSRSST